MNNFTLKSQIWMWKTMTSRAFMLQALFLNQNFILLRKKNDATLHNLNNLIYFPDKIVNKPLI